MASVPREDSRLEQTILKMQEDIASLRMRQPSIPILAADPEDASIRLWMLNDGRLRGRKADNAVVEYSVTTHHHDERYALKTIVVPPTPGGSTSTQPPAPPPYVPSTQVYEQQADWTQTYSQGGSTKYSYENSMFYGRYSARDGEFKSMMHFPGLSAALAPGPAGCRIAEVWLRLSNMHTYLNSGAALRIGWHGADTVPGSFGEAGVVGEIHVAKVQHNAWFQLSNGVGEAARDSGLKGLTLNQLSTAIARYGKAGAVGTGGFNPPALKVVYVK